MARKPPPKSKGNPISRAVKWAENYEIFDKKAPGVQAGQRKAQQQRESAAKAKKAKANTIAKAQKKSTKRSGR